MRLWYSLAALAVIKKLFRNVLNIVIGIVSRSAANYRNVSTENYGRGKELLKPILKCRLLPDKSVRCCSKFYQDFDTDSDLYTQFAALCLKVYLSLISFPVYKRYAQSFCNLSGMLKQPFRYLFICSARRSLDCSLRHRTYALGSNGNFGALPVSSPFAAAITTLVMEDSESFGASLEALCGYTLREFKHKRRFLNGGTQF